jgi:hypothetical protein
MCKRSTSIIMAGLTLGGLLLMGSPAGAQSVYDPNIDQQQQRIQQGADTGALTPGETRHLERQQGHIQATEDHMGADGRLSYRERQRLAEMQERANRNISRLKHNGRTGDDWHGGNYQGWSGHTNSGWDNRAHYGGDGRQYVGRDDHRRPYDPRFDHREDYQQRRIHQGVRAGNLTPGEARYLGREQGRIQSVEDRMRADGRLSPQERQRLNQMQNNANRDIYRLSNNGRGNDGYGPNRAGWQGPNQGWGGHGSWQGNHPGGYGNTPGGAPVTNAATGGPGPGNGRGWWGNRGENGYQHGGPPAAPGNPQVWRGGNTPNGPGGAYQPGPGPQTRGFAQPANWQGQPRVQQARPQPMQPMMRPHNNMMPRQAGGGMVNRAGSAGMPAGRRR